MHRLMAAKTYFILTALLLSFSTFVPAHAQTVPDEVPLLMRDLQAVSSTHKGDTLIADDPFLGDNFAQDLRRDAQRQAALSFGARGALARRSYEIMEQMRGHEAALDGVFNFRRLLVEAPSGLLIEPPIVSESENALIITEGGVEAAVADKIFNINKDAKIVTAPRDWRHYIYMDWGTVEPPPKILWPRNALEQAEWDGWVAQGWKEGYGQASEIFEVNLNRLLADFTGMVRYRLLLAQGMISKPYALHEDRGITGGGNVMRVGDRALRITGPSQFQMGSEEWRPADR